MRRILIAVVLIGLLAMPVQAIDVTAPMVPESGRQFMPSTADSLGQGLLELLRDVVLHLDTDLKEAASVCLGIVAAVLITSVLKTFTGTPARVTDLAGTVAIATMLLGCTNSMVSLAADTVVEISEYGKLLLPVMTSAFAAQGSVSASAALYGGTVAFDILLCALISSILTPLIYFYISLAVANSAVAEEMLGKLRDQLKGIITWGLKTVLYIFTGYISITGVVSGATDAAALKAAKLAIAGAVPVVGGILSDASEAVLVTAGTVKNAAGIYGMLAVLAIWVGPFVKIGAQYLMLKITGTLCDIFGSKSHSALIQDFSSAMGMLLAMTGSVCLMLMISLVCFMKGGG